MHALGTRDIFLFNGFHLDHRGLFRRDDHGVLTPVAIGGRAFELLHVLIDRHGEIISKIEIMAAVWPQTVVEESNLAFQIAALRRVLDRRRTESSCIQTVARRGYRFAAAVTRFEAEALEGADREAIYPGGATRWSRLSIFVLPFANLSSDPEQGYFASGITDDLTTDLSQISEHFAIASGTAFTYDRELANPKQLGREVGAHYVVQGSVRRSGSRVRINVQLIDVETVGLMWAERFEIERRNLSAAQDEIIGRLARALHFELLKDGDRRSRKARAVDPNTHDLLIRAWAWFYRPRSTSSLQEAQREFDRALELEPSSIEARIGLATALIAVLLEGWSACLLEDQARAEQLLAEAFACATNYSVAHQAMAMLRRSQNRLVEARIAADMAVALDRNNTGALYELGLAYLYLGQPRAGIPHIERAIALSSRDPFVSDMYFGLGKCHLLLGRFDLAIELFYRTRAVRPQFWDVYIWLAAALGVNGDLDRARAELNEARRLKPEVDLVARWRACQPYIGVLSYWTLCNETLNVGLHRAGFPQG